MVLGNIGADVGAVASGGDAARNELSAQGGQRGDESGVHARGASMSMAQVRGGRNSNTEAFGGKSDHEEDISDDSGESESRSNSHHEEEQEDSDWDGDGDEFEGPDPRKSYFRSPKSTETCAAVYNALLPTLEEFLHSRFDEYLVLLLVACHGNATSMIEVPFVFVGIPHDETSIPNVEEFPSAVQESKMGLALCRLRVEQDLEESASCKRPYRHIRSGLSVGHGEVHSTTIGALVKRQNGSFIGITAGHLVDSGFTESNVTQPSLFQVEEELLRLQEKSEGWTQNINMSRNEEERKSSLQQKDKVDSQIAELKQFIGKTSSETLAKIKVGTIIQREYQCVRVGDRNCISDFLLFDVIPERQPGQLDRWEFRPPEMGELGKGTWLMLNDWGEVALDVQVRKNGSVTGFTYGFVSGVKAHFCSKNFKSPLSEYYILEERDVTNHQFAYPGDSGSAVVSKEGKLIGLIIARAVFQKLEVLVRPVTIVPDIKAMRNARQLDGTIQKEKAGRAWSGKPWFNTFTGVTTTLVMCANVLEARSGIRGMGILYSDC
jgi:hypothetical protein